MRGCPYGRGTHTVATNGPVEEPAEEFKRDAVDLVHSTGRPIRQRSRESRACSTDST